MPATIGVMAHHRRILSGVGGFEYALEKSRALPASIKALADIKTATLIGCRFCIDIGTHLAAGRGVSEAQLLALVDPAGFATSPHFSQLEKQVLTLVEQMSATPATPSTELVADLREQLGNQALVELIAVIAWENFRARFNHAIGAQEEGFSSQRVCLLPPRGAQLLAHE